jgi:glutamate dehydrogenase (NAD(P)+)
MEKKIISVGAGERELVYSGLHETMANAYGEVRKIAHEKVSFFLLLLLLLLFVFSLAIVFQKVNLRTGAYISAVSKIAKAYEQLGIFP